MNSYPSILQTSSYNFSAEKTTGEVWAWIVKAAGEKKAAQHSADLAKLEDEASVNGISITEQRKQVECICIEMKGLLILRSSFGGPSGMCNDQLRLG